MPTEIGPHNLTSDFSGVTPIVREITSFTTFLGWKLFDGLVGPDQWLGTGGGPPWWVTIYFGNLQTLGSYAMAFTLQGVGATNRGPGAWQMQGSNDNLNWTTLDTRSGITWATEGQVQTFTCTNVSTSYRAFRLLISANGGASDGTCGFAELYLYGASIPSTVFSPSGASIPSPFVVTASSEFSTDVRLAPFENSPTGQWIGTGGGVDWLQLDVGVGVTQALGAYAIMTNIQGPANRAPKSWTMLGSNDGSTWTTVDTQTNQTTWGTGEIRCFNCASTPFRYWRLNITSNNGDATFTEVDKLYLYGPGAAPIVAQTITFPPIPNQNQGVSGFNLPPGTLYVTNNLQTIKLAATASSGLPVSYAVLSGPAVVAGNILTITGFGNVVVQASQTGNAGFSAATPVNQTFNVVPQVSVPTFSPGAANTVINSQPMVAGMVSQSVGLYRYDLAVAVSVSLSFSGDPGPFQIDLQTADMNSPNNFDTLESITQAELNANFVGRIAATDVVARFVRLLVVSVTNPVNITATIS